MKKRTGIILTVLVLMGLAQVPMVSAETITYWHFYGSNFGRIHEAAIAEFNDTHPDIQVKSQYIGSAWTGRDKLFTAVASDAAPDISQVDDYWIPQLAATDNIIKLGDYITSETKSDIYPLFWESASYEGDIWAMPYASSNLVLFYNKDLFREAGLNPNTAPETWDELITYATKLTSEPDKRGTVDQWGLMFPTLARAGVIYNYLPFLWQNNGELLSPDNSKAIFNSAAGIGALQYMADLVHKYKVMPAAPPSNGFRTGAVAMTIASCARLNTIYRPAINFEIGVAPLPANKSEVTVAGGKYFVAFNRSKMSAIMTFINWMTNTENNLEWSKETGYMPLRKSVVDSPVFQRYLVEEPESKVAVDQISFTRPRPSIAAYGDISRVIGGAVEAALVAGMDPAEALNNAVPEANNVLDDWEERLK